MNGPWWTAGEAIAELWRLEGRDAEFAYQRLDALRHAGIVERLASEADRLLYAQHPELAQQLAVACACLLFLQRNYDDHEGGDDDA
jgi:Fe2+ or Zn2+ uptake regulation protein